MARCRSHDASVDTTPATLWTQEASKACGSFCAETAQLRKPSCAPKKYSQLRCREATTKVGLNEICISARSN